MSAKLHFTLVSTFHSMRCFPGLPLFLLMKLNLSLTSEVTKHIIIRDLSFSEYVNLMFVSLVGFYLNQAHFHIWFLCTVYGSNHRNAVSFLVKFLCVIVNNISVMWLCLIGFVLWVISQKSGPKFCYTTI